MTQKKTILKDTGIYALTSYTGQFFDVLTSILTRRFLGPANMGIWAFLQVIQGYAKHAGLGITTATARDVPYYLGKGDLEQARRIQNLVFTFTMGSTLLAALGILGYALLTRHKHPPEIIWGLLCITAVVLLQRLYNLYIVLLRAYKEFRLVGSLNIVSSVLTLLLTIALIRPFFLYGLYASLILNFVILLVFLHFRTPYRFQLSFNLRELKPILNLGAAMFVYDLLGTIFNSVDRIMITRTLGFTALGYYSVSFMAANYLYALPNMMGMIFFPHFQEAFARKDDPRDLEKFLNKPTLCVACVYPTVIGLLWIWSPLLIQWVLPKFTDGIPSLRIFILSSYFIGLTHPFSNLVLTVKKHWLLIPFQAVSILLSFFLAWLFLEFGWGLEGVALSRVLMALAQFAALAFISYRVLARIQAFREIMLKTLLLFGAFTAVLMLNHRFWSPSGIPQLAAETAVFMLCMIPFYVIAERSTGIFSTLQHMIRDKFMRPAAGAP